MEPAEQSREGSGRAGAPTPAEVTENTEAVKAVGRRAGGLVIGVAPVDAFNEFVPEGHRPQDLLAQAADSGGGGRTGCLPHRRMAAGYRIQGRGLPRLYEKGRVFFHPKIPEKMTRWLQRGFRAEKSCRARLAGRDNR